MKSLEDSNALIDGIAETVKHEIIKKTRKQISSCFVSTFSHLISARGGGVRWAGRGYKAKKF